MTYPIGSRLLLKTPLHYQKPAWYEVKTEPNRWGIILVQADSGAISGLTTEQIKHYEQEAKSESLCS